MGVDFVMRRWTLEGLGSVDRWSASYPLQVQELDRPLQEAVDDFARVRRRTVDLMHGWGKSEWERLVSDPRAGDVTLLDICRRVSRHEIAHIVQIRNLTALLPEPEDLGPPTDGHRIPSAAPDIG